LAVGQLAGEAVRATRRVTAVLPGVEIDVCDAQSAIGLPADGVRTVIIEGCFLLAWRDARTRTRPCRRRGAWS
jgi:hypothetical protein